jgi:hypothetical protein
MQMAGNTLAAHPRIQGEGTQQQEQVSNTIQPTQTHIHGPNGSSSQTVTIRKNTAKFQSRP